MRKALFALAIIFAAPAAAQQPQRETPYWASIAAGEALMRTGPGRNYPATWLYRRAELPVRIVEVYPSWRKIEDPDGTTGWMLVNLLSGTRTGLVRGDGPAPLHETPSPSARIAYRAAPGVVGKISRCAGAWCRFETGGRGGFIARDRLWGVDPGERVE